MMKDKKQLVTITGLSRKLYGISASWLLCEAKAGRIPAINADGRYLFNIEAVRAALSRRAKGADHAED